MWETQAVVLTLIVTGGLSALLVLYAVIDLYRHGMPHQAKD